MKNNVTLQDKMVQAIATGKVGNLKLSVINVPRLVIEHTNGKPQIIDLSNGTDDNGSQARLETLVTALCYPQATVTDAEYVVVDVGSRQSVRHTLRTSLTGCTLTTSYEGTLSSESLDRHTAALAEQSAEEIAGLPAGEAKKAVRLFNWTSPDAAAVEKSDKDGAGYDRRLEQEYCVFYLNSITGAWRMVKKPNVADLYAPLQSLAIPQDIENADLLEALAHAPKGEPEMAYRYIAYPRVANPKILNR